MTITTDTVRAAIPAIGDLAADLAEAVAETWRRAWASSPYESLDDAPFSGFLPQRSLLEHVNNVNVQAARLIEVAAAQYGLPVDHDRALAAAILHDVDKLQIFRWDGRDFSIAEGTSRAEHGPMGAALALECGVPEDIAVLVRDHSQANSPNLLPASAEAAIMLYADMTDADLASVRYGTEPSFRRSRPVRRS
ncbi:HDIG domain-containing metalloprotein [Dactylosporangium sp. CS-033363]|uniref:HDIG domain-containing metalloprotein n=1 Tax=Dactylosporangium sp. CS-033363 TaxID=3239935 RepID=UPI003D900667